MTKHLSMLSLATLTLGGCDYTGDWLFAGVVEGLPDVYEIRAENGELIVPADITTVDELRAATIYAEIGPPGTTAYGGATFEFVGTGGDVCVWVDPEVAWWNQSVAIRPDSLATKWTWPDNAYDDGDIDLFAGLSVYYTGSPGETIGDFVVAYEDSLRNDIPISLAACPNLVGPAGDDATAGKGSPEFCTIPGTDLDISYTVLLRTWSTPLDDDRLSFGVIIANGDCATLQALGGGGSQELDECVIMGEALVPEKLKGDADNYTPYYGFDAASEHVWPRSMDFEVEFCTAERMRKFCKDEEERILEDDLQCLWNDFDPDDFNPDEKCYCGNPDDTPAGGAI